MGLDGGIGDAERLGHFGDAADLDDGEQHAELGRRQSIGLREHFRRGRRLQADPMDEDRGRRAGSRHARPRLAGEGKHMGDALLAIRGRERDTVTAPRRRGVPVTGGKERGLEPLVCRPARRRKPASPRSQDLPFGQERAAGGIGVEQPSARSDQKYAGAHGVEHVGEGRCLGGSVIDRLADQHGAADVRGEQRGAPPHLVIDEAGAFVAHDAEDRAARRRLVDDHVRRVAETLGPHPFLIESPAAELVELHHLGA